MIYKIEGEFNDNNFGDIVSKLSKKFVFTYMDNVMFIALKTIEDKEKHRAIIKSIFKPASDFFVTEITEKNIMRLAPVIKEWCRDNFVRLERERFEKNEQEKLRQVWRNMDLMEEYLSSQMLEKKKKENDKNYEEKEEGG